MSDDSTLDDIIRNIPSQMFRTQADNGDQRTTEANTVSNSVISVSSGDNSESLLLDLPTVGPNTVSNSVISVSSGDISESLLSDLPTLGASTVSNSVISVSSGDNSESLLTGLPVVGPSTVSDPVISVSSGDTTDSLLSTQSDTLLLFSDSTTSYDQELMTLWDYSPPGNLDPDMNANRDYLDVMKVMDLESQHNNE